MTTNIHLSSSGIARIFLFTIAILLALNLAVVYLHFVKGYQYMKGFVHAFYFDGEANYPSLYSTLAILMCSILFWRIGSTGEEMASKRSLYWRGLSFLFIFLALDEFASIHEDLIKPFKKVLSDMLLESDYLYFAWFVPYTIGALLIAVIYIKFFFSLPFKTRSMLFAGIMVFFSGAVVMEMIGGKYWAKQGWSIEGTDPVDLRYALIVTLEELLEMIGILIFIYALSGYYLKDGSKHSYMIQVSDPETRSSTYIENKVVEKQ